MLPTLLAAFNRFNGPIVGNRELAGVFERNAGQSVPDGGGV
jgi:hypothetical protein